jgi:hypothetical protein
MATRSFVLTELEEFVLAACDDQNVGALVARDIISRYLARDISLRDMRRAYERLLGLGLVDPFRGRHGDRRIAPLKGTRTRDFSFKATHEGVLYLKRSRHVV